MAHRPEIYAVGDQYDRLLPPYLFPGSNGPQTDEDILQAYLLQTFGAPDQQLSIFEDAAGTGRMTNHLLPYASSIVCADKHQGVLGQLRGKYPWVRTVQANTRDISGDAVGRDFDLIGSFWAISYAIGECLETIEDDGTITPVTDLEEGVREAHRCIGNVVGLLASEGRFVSYLFDSECPEQQAVTRIWEQLGPDPGGHRSFTRELLTDALDVHASTQGKRLAVIHHIGQVSFTDKGHLLDFYANVHAKGNTQLIDTPIFREETSALIAAHTNPDGTIGIPTGMYEFRVEPN
ncbi:MAG: hypothetical protein AAB834_08035 [Patescibacteria group bacterium]